MVSEVVGETVSVVLVPLVCLVFVLVPFRQLRQSIWNVFLEHPGTFRPASFNVLAIGSCNSSWQANLEACNRLLL